MIGRIVRILIAAAVIVFILLWLWSGGWSTIVRFVKTIPNPIDIIWGTSTSTYQVKFPWQIDTPRGADISGLAERGDSLSGSAPDTSSSDSQSVQSKNFGSPSPSRGIVSLSQGSARESDAQSEYLEISSRSQSGVSLSGWSLQSALSGVRVFIPGAAHPFYMGRVNTPGPITLGPGESAIIVSGASPVGVSFKENRCTGYLAQTQVFQPSLQNACPGSADLAPLSAENLQQYGSACMDFARSIPSCTYPTTLPDSLTPGCRAYITSTFSYAGCVDRLSAGPNFSLPYWRVYLNSTSEFWDNRHDIIRLLDQNGLTVDAVSY